MDQLDLFSGSGRLEWGLVLAGGDGERLRPLTRAIAGDDRPKQFCALLGRGSLLERTWRRVGRSVHRDRTLTVLTRTHERYYAPLLAGVPGRRLIVQPANRGTAPAILWGALRIAHAAPGAAMAVFPCDHLVSDDAAFMRHVAVAFAAVHARPDLVVLLGVAPDRAETGYGWIEPAEPVASGALRRVRRFWEKPDRAVAERLLAMGCLWNCFVVVARAPALLSLLRRAVPDLVEAFAPLPPMFDTAAESAVAKHVYAGLPSVDFSAQVLAAGAANLAVLPVKGVAWSDVGEPRRLLAEIAALDRASRRTGAVAGGATA